MTDYCNLVVIAVLLLFADLVPLVSAPWRRKTIIMTCHEKNRISFFSIKLKIITDTLLYVSDLVHWVSAPRRRKIIMMSCHGKNMS